MRQVIFPARETAALLERPSPAEANGLIKPDDVRGSTLVSLVSPGTELNWGYLGQNFPAVTGYACVFRIEETGSAVTDLCASATSSSPPARTPSASRPAATRSRRCPPASPPKSPSSPASWA